MSMPDKLVLGLTAKQLLITLIGGTIGYDIWVHLYALLAYGLLGLITRLLFSLIPAALALALALVSIAGRPLEIWTLVILRYMQQPKTYVWRSIRSQVRPAEPAEEEEQQHVEEVSVMESRALERV